MQGKHVRLSVLVLSALAGTVCVGSPAADGVSNIAVKIETVAGAPRISIDGVARAGVCAVPLTPDSTEKIQLGLKDFADMGVEFYSVVIYSRGKNNNWWLGEGKYDFAALDRQIQEVLAVHQSGYVFPRIKCNPPEWWAKENPGEMRAGIENPASLKWRALASRMLGDVVRHIEGSDYAHRVIGYHIASMGSSEWEIWPWPKDEESPQTGDLRDPLPPVADFAARRDYVVRRNAAVADSLLALAKAVKEACGGRKLVGAFFGYLVSQDHREFSRVCASGLVDFFCAPGNYYDRRPGQPASFQNVYLASMRLHNRLYWDEADVRTWLAPFRYENAILCDYYCHSRYETVNVLKRNSGFALTGGVENWWFLLAGNETFHDEIALAPIRQAFIEEKATLRQVPAMKTRVAVFTSAEEYLSSCYTPSQALAEDVKWDFHQRTLRRVGVPFDCYELADVEAANLPDYDVYVFPNAYTLSAARRMAIERLVRRKGKTAIWIYAPGYYRDGKGSAANVADLTGIALKENYPVYDGPLSRTFEVEGGPAKATRTFPGGWRSVYFQKCPKLSELRKALEEAGVHIWSSDEDVVAVGRDYLMIHASSEGLKRLPLGGAYDVREIFAASPDLKGAREITEYLRLGETRIYHLTECKQ